VLLSALATPGTGYLQSGDIGPARVYYGLGNRTPSCDPLVRTPLIGQMTLADSKQEVWLDGLNVCDTSILYLRANPTSTNLYYVRNDAGNFSIRRLSIATPHTELAIAVENAAPNGLVLDSSNLYWSVPSSLRKRAQSGGPLTTLLSAAAGETLRLFEISGASLFFVSWTGTGDSLQTTIKKIPVTGGAPTILRTLPLGKGVLDAVAGEGYLYWTETVSGLHAWSVNRVSQTGTAYLQLYAAPTDVWLTGLGYKPNNAALSKKLYVGAIRALGGPSIIASITAPTSTSGGTFAVEMDDRAQAVWPAMFKFDLASNKLRWFEKDRLVSAAP
jgi:hypothetical protein